MNTKVLKKIKKEAWIAGENDTHTEQVLIDSALLFIDECPTDELTDEEHDQIIEAYRAGFMGKKLL